MYCDSKGTKYLYFDNKEKSVCIVTVNVCIVTVHVCIVTVKVCIVTVKVYIMTVKDTYIVL